MRKSPLRVARYVAEAVLVYPLYALAWLLPVKVASAVGAGIGAVFYYLHKGTAKARRNLQRVLPEQAAEHENIIKGMWQNFGRVLLEYPHLKTLWHKGYITVVGHEKLLAHQGKPCVFVAIHQANWEVALLTAARQGWYLAAIYRPLNNFLVDPLLRFARRVSKTILLPKTAEGGVALIRHVRAGGSAAMLIDQRLGDGISVPFFGLPALSPPLAATLAIRYGITLIPVQVERMHGCHLRVTVHDAPPLPDASDRNEAITALTAALYAQFEGWIRARPAQWLWMHDRWRPKKPI